MSPVPGEPLMGPLLVTGAMMTRPHTPQPELRLFSYGRQALVAYLRTLQPVPLLLVPAYVCVEATAPVQAAGFRVAYYAVTDSLEPDWAWIEANGPKEETSFLLVHYFGITNDVEKAAAVCRARGWRLIEDCAHSFLTEHQGKRVGTFGDAAIYSYRKTLPMPDGAALLDATRPAGDAVHERGSPPLTLVLRKLGKAVLYRAGLPNAMWRRLATTPVTADDAAADARGPAGMSTFSRRLFAALEPRFGAIAEARRRNYEDLALAFSEFEEVQLPYPTIDEGTCPQLFPLLVDGRDGVRDRLRSMGVPAGSWPTLPSDLPPGGETAVARRIADRLLTLPVHQDVSETGVRTMIRAYGSIRSRGNA